jgi:hypothetical protein
MSLPSIFRSVTQAAAATAAALFHRTAATAGAEGVTGVSCDTTLRAIVVVYTQINEIENRAVAPYVCMTTKPLGEP